MNWTPKVHRMFEKIEDAKKQYKKGDLKFTRHTNFGVGADLLQPYVPKYQLWQVEYISEHEIHWIQLASGQPIRVYKKKQEVLGKLKPKEDSFLTPVVGGYIISGHGDNAEYETFD